MQQPSPQELQVHPSFLPPTGSHTLMVSRLLSGAWGSCEAPLS